MVLLLVEVIVVVEVLGLLDVSVEMPTVELRVLDLLNLCHVLTVVHRQGVVQEQSPAC